MNQAVGISVLPSLSGTDRAKRIFSQIVFISSCCFFGCEAFLAPIPHVWPLRPGGLWIRQDPAPPLRGQTTALGQRCSHHQEGGQSRSPDTGQGAGWEQGDWL